MPFQNTPENAREILRNLGRNIDIVAGLFDDTWEETRGCAALKMEEAPICCAVGFHHRLAVKARLTIDDLRRENLMLIRRGLNVHVDKLRDFAAKENINIIDFDFFDLGVFNRCEIGGDVLMAFSLWQHAHPLVKIIPVDWDFTVPFGLLHAHSPSQTVSAFLSALAKPKDLLRG
jgi:hypothetical protein